MDKFRKFLAYTWLAMVGLFVLFLLFSAPLEAWIGVGVIVGIASLLAVTVLSFCVINDDWPL